MLFEKLIQLRKQAGYTQEHLAKILGIPRPTYSNYERPKEASGREPNVEMLIRLADIYDVSLDYLVGRTDDPLSKKSNGVNLRQLLNLDLHWDGVPLSDKEIRPIANLLEVIVHERMLRVENESEDDMLSAPKKDDHEKLADEFLN